MDVPSHKSRRSSILKLRQSDIIVENTIVDDDQKQVAKRRVSFHNVKTIQNFGSDNLNLLDGSPFREKIQETLNSDGVLTPGRSHITSSTPSATYGHNDVQNTIFMDTSMIDGHVPSSRSHEKTNYSSSDMSIDNATSSQVEGADLSCSPVKQPDLDILNFNRASTDFRGFTSTSNNMNFEEIENDTLLILNTQSGEHVPVLNTSRRTEEFADKTSTTMFLDETELVFDAINCELCEDKQNGINVSSEKSGYTKPEDTMGILENVMPEMDKGDIGDSSDRSSNPPMENLPDIMDVEISNTTFQDVRKLNFGRFGIFNDIRTHETSEMESKDKFEAAMEVFFTSGPDAGRNSSDVQPKICSVVIDSRTDASCPKVDNNDISTAENVNENKTVFMSNTSQILDESGADLRTVSIENVSEINYSNNDSPNDANITRRDISLMQVGSRFRASTSSKDDTVLSLQSLVDESVCFRKRMMFDSQSLQVNYVSPATDQPESNNIRAQILEELRRKVLEIMQNSSSKIAIFLPKLHAVCPAKAIAIKNMDIRALQLDDIELLHCGRLRTEVEWAQIRLNIAEEARSALEMSIVSDESTLKACREVAQLCCSTDQLKCDVQALQTELDGLPSADEIIEIIFSHKEAVKDEKHLDNQILDLEFEELRLESELAKAKFKELNETITKLDDLANAIERNRARVREFTRKIVGQNN